MSGEWLKIGEVARRTGLTVRSLHHYDDLGLLVASGRSSGEHRLYAPADLRRLLAIQHLRSLGLSLAETKAALDDPSFDPAAALETHIDMVEGRLDAERRLLDRLRALRDTADAGWEEVVEAIALTAGLAHPESTVRYRAALDTRATPLSVLVDQLADDPDPMVREGLTWAVARHGSRALAPLLARVADPDPVVRFQVVRAIGKVGEPAAAGYVVPALVPLLTDPEVAVRSEAVFALGRFGGPEALTALTARLAEGDDRVRDRLVDVLESFGEEAVSPLVTALASPYPRVRVLALTVLGRLESPAVAGVLGDVARRVQDPDAAVALAALFALAGRQGFEVDEAIERAAAHGDPRLAALAARLTADRAARPPRDGIR